MNKKNAMTRITSLVWGEVKTSDGRVFKDAIVTSDAGARPWDWARDGTRHQSGITPAAVRPYLDYDVVILSKGMHDRLHTMPETRGALRHARVYELSSAQAARKYNQEVRKGTKQRTVIFLHSTC